MLIWRFPYCCLLRVGGVGVNCNVWGWTLVRTHWGRGPAVTSPPPRQAVFVNDPSFQAPSCGGASSWLVKEYKKRNPGMQFPAIPLVDVVWRRPHTLPSVKVLWLQGCLCRCASYSQEFIHILGDLGESPRPFKKIFINECRAQHPAGLSLCCL